MKKGISFLIGFIMLFWLPMDSKGFVFYFFVWLPIAILLLAYSGAFKKSTDQKPAAGQDRNTPQP